jgi:hypothetical protein
LPPVVKPISCPTAYTKITRDFLISFLAIIWAKSTSPVVFPKENGMTIALHLSIAYAAYSIEASMQADSDAEFGRLGHGYRKVQSEDIHRR